MRILLTGASGLIGSRVRRALVQRGDEVIAVSRRPRAAGERLRWVHGDPCAVRTYEPVIGTCDGVVNLAGEPMLGLWTAGRKRRIADSRTDTTHALVHAMTGAATRPQVFVSGSAVGVYGSDAEAMFDEGAPAGDGFLADVCRRWEAAALPAESAGVRTVLLRTGLVLAGEGGLLPPLAGALRLGGGAVIGDGRAWMAWVHIDDVVGIILRALADPAWRGPVNAVAPGPVRQREMVEVLGRVLGRPVWLTLPGWLLTATLGEFARETLLASQRAEPARAKAFGYRFQYERLEGALRAALGERSRSQR